MAYCSKCGKPLTDDAKFCATPPPIPNTIYHIAKNGKSLGAFDLATLKEMARKGELAPDDLVWRQGMTSWEKAHTMDALNGIFLPSIL